jgi:hypothetical protein
MTRKVARVNEYIYIPKVILRIFWRPDGENALRQYRGSAGPFDHTRSRSRVSLSFRVAEK